MSSLIIGLCCAVLLTAAEGTAPILLTANEHPWGHFQPKSWNIVQTVIISNLEGRAIQSTHKVKTTLQSIDANGITLQESETFELGGKIVEKKPQTVQFDFFQEPVQENIQIRQGLPVKLMIDKKVVPCAVRVYEQQTAGGLLTTTIWHTPHVYPHVLRVEKILRSSPDNENTGGRILRQSITLVQETSALKNTRISRRNKTYRLQTVEKAGNVTKITDALCSWDKPGGLLESTTREFDTQNREIRRSVSQMTNYYSHQPIPVLPQRYRPWTPIETD